MTMLPEVKHYLIDVKFNLRLDPAKEGQIIRELYTHFEERVRDLHQAGMSEHEAAKTATESLGGPKLVAKEIYRVYSIGSWHEAMMAALPHILIALLFAYHLWQTPLWASIFLVAIVLVALYGWRHSSPTWFYPWLGYSLVPLIIAAFVCTVTVAQFFSLRSLGMNLDPNALALLAALAYLPIAFAITLWIVVRVVRRDWIYASLMALPLPFLAGWLYLVERQGKLIEYDKQSFRQEDMGMTLIFLALAITAAAFIRLRDRVLKVGSVILTALLVFSIVSNYALGYPSLLWLIGTALVLVLFLLSPALLERKIGRGETNGERLSDNWLEQVLGEG